MRGFPPRTELSSIFWRGGRLTFFTELRQTLQHVGHLVQLTPAQFQGTEPLGPGDRRHESKNTVDRRAEPILTLEYGKRTEETAHPVVGETLRPDGEVLGRGEDIAQLGADIVKERTPQEILEALHGRRFQEETMLKEMEEDGGDTYLEDVGDGHTGGTLGADQPVGHVHH